MDHPDEPEPRRPGAVLGVLVGYLVVLLGGAAAVLSVPNASFRAAAAGASVVLLAVLSWAAERLWVGGTGAARRELLGVFAASTLMLVALGALPA